MKEEEIWGTRRAFERDLKALEKLPFELIPWEETELTEKGYLLILEPSELRPFPRLFSSIPLFSLDLFAYLIAPMKKRLSERQFRVYDGKFKHYRTITIHWPRERIFFLSGEEPPQNEVLKKDFILLSGAHFLNTYLVVFSKVHLPLLPKPYFTYRELSYTWFFQKRILSLRSGIEVARRVLYKHEAQLFLMAYLRKNPPLKKALDGKVDWEHPVRTLRKLEKALQDDFSFVDLLLGEGR